MKSVTIKDRYGNLLLKVIHRKAGKYDLFRDEALADIDVDVRDDRGCKVTFDR
jgi:hypothetical protein